MNVPSSTFVYLSALAVFAMGAVVSFIWWDLGFAVMLTSIGIACISRYRSASTGFSGSLALIPALIIFVYAYGSYDREAPVFSTNVSPTVWAIIVVGSLSLILGLWFAGGSSQSEPGLGELDFKTSEIFLWIGIAALALSILNYATGDIPLLSGDIDGSRFGGNFGVASRFWAVINPIMQVSVIIFLLKLQQRRLDLRWSILGIGSAASLVLTAGRSLVGITLIAFGLIFLELKRPKIQAILFATVGGLLLFGAIGQFRALSSANAAGFQSYMSRRNLDSWFGSTDLSLQTGPRVMTLAIDSLHGRLLGGRFLIADLPYLRDPSIVGSDRLVTSMLGRDPGLGGLPPTIFGGLYLDFGWLGVVTGALLVGLALAYSRRLMYSSPSLPTLVWFSYLAAYIAVSGYSYISLRPSWLVVLMICVAAQIVRRGANGPDFNRLEVQEFPGRSRTSHK